MPTWMCSLCLCLLSCCHGAQTFQYQIFLDPDGRYQFQWSVDYTRQVIDVQLIAQVDADTWFAVGFSDYGDVTFADLAVFWTDKGGNHHFVDGHTDRRGILRADDHQSYQLTSVSSRPGAVVLDFTRPFDTCDVRDYRLDNGTTHIVCIESLQPTEIPLGTDVTQLRHSVQRSQLLKPEVVKPKFPEDTWTFDVVAQEVLVPGEETTYWWHTTLLPDIPQPHHIIQYEGIISEGSEDLVHHMEVFHCELTRGERIPYYNGPGLAEDKPEGLDVCRKVIGAWAMGAEAMVYPQEAGVPIGGKGYSRFALLEVHYNNPRRMKGRMDKSGLRFHVTSQLRQYDAGIMELGLEYTNKMAVPPGQAVFQLTGYCVHACTRVGLPAQGIHVFASQLHTHLTGRRVYTRHVRGGVELAELNRDNHYSPHFQEIRRLWETVHVLPGDDLITTCEYDTRSRKHATVGGFSITDEMCLNYIHYYPRSMLEVCKSSVQTEALHTFFYLLNRLEGEAVYPDAGDRSNYRHVEWSSNNVALLQDLYATSPLSMQCNKSDGTRFPGGWDQTPVTDVVTPLVVTDTKTCQRST
ncbi:dopamine beta-hydroxylase-like [Physella acuta]|uniref:dopamine beta-hydroxylase-like n=1 Tax=Physella acuta TaxID=109671 RepID=UPI0027DC5E40|nr:dopamine beta-hydroxylase-like [Physella acuta]